MIKLLTISLWIIFIIKFPIRLVWWAFISLGEFLEENKSIAILPEEQIFNKINELKRQAYLKTKGK